MTSLIKVLSVSVIALGLTGCFEAHKKAAVKAGATMEEICEWVYKNHVVAVPDDTRKTREKSAAGITWYNENC